MDSPTLFEERRNTQTARGGRIVPARCLFRAALIAIMAWGITPGYGDDSLLWEALGPGNIGGRTRALLLDPVNPGTMYAAGVAGGVWKTSDDGVSWTPLSDHLANLSVCALSFELQGTPRVNTSVLYAGTGEGFCNLDALRGAGIFKSVDAGVTWRHLAATENANFHYVNAIVASPNTAATIYAATRTGIWKSRNGGDSWVCMLSNDGLGGQSHSQVATPLGFTDLVIRTDRAADTLFAANGVTVTDGLYRSLDGGASWSRVFTDPQLGRSDLAIARSDQNTIYSLSSNRESEHRLLNVFRSTDGGQNWEARTAVAPGPCSEDLLACCGWYANIIAVAPHDPNLVFAAGERWFRSEDGGASWSAISARGIGTPAPLTGVAGQHALAFHPAWNGDVNQTLIVGNDSGIYRTDNALGASWNSGLSPKVAWESINHGYVTAQFYHGRPFPGPESVYLGGCQDTGTLMGSDARGSDLWTVLLRGDGGYVSYDAGNMRTLFAEHTYKSLKRSRNGGLTFEDIVNGSGQMGEDPAYFPYITPFRHDPSNPERLWYGGISPWRSENAASALEASAVCWIQAGAPLPGGGTISAWAIDPHNSDRVWVGLSDGVIATTNNATGADAQTIWMERSPPFSGPACISWVEVDENATDGNTVYATNSAYGAQHVFMTRNGGLNWTNITGNLPDIPVHCLVVQPEAPHHLLVGTGLGVYRSKNTGGTWENINAQGLPNVAVESLEFQDTHVLYAFTHGRGAFRAIIDPPPPDVTLHLLVQPEGRGQVIADPPSGVYPRGAMVSLTAVAETGWEFDHWIGGVADPAVSPTTIRMDGDSAVTACFREEPRYVLNLSVEGQGGVAANPAQGTYAPDMRVRLTATANTGWRFDHWSGDFQGRANPAFITMDSDKCVTAVFVVEVFYTLEVLTDPDEAGDVLLNPAGLTYLEGTQVRVEAVGRTGWEFDHWEGDLEGGLNPASLLMNGNKRIAAVFVSDGTHTLRREASPVDGGYVFAAPPGDVYPEGSKVRIEAQASAEWRFEHWEGDLSGAENPTTLIIDGFKRVIGVFEPLPRYSLTAQCQPAESGLIVASPPGITYLTGTEVHLAAIVNSGWRFDHWEGPVTAPTAASTTVKMTADRTVTAVFAPEVRYTLTAEAAPSEAGQVAMSPSGETFPEGSEVTLTATSNTGWNFDHWEDSLSGKTNPAHLVINRDMAVRAVFRPDIRYVLTARAEPAESGGIILTPSGGSYSPGTEVGLFATAASGWEFDHWQGAVVNPLVRNTSLVMNEHQTVAAVFRRVYTLIIMREGTGDLDPPAGQYVFAAGADVTIQANPAEGWVFDGWRYDATGAEPVIHLAMDANHRVKAVFKRLRTVIIAVEGQGTCSPPPGVHTYPEGIIITLRATPDMGHLFTGWEGDASGDNPVIELALDADKQVTGVFAPVQKDGWSCSGRTGTESTPVSSYDGLALSLAFLVILSPAAFRARRKA